MTLALQSGHWFRIAGLRPRLGAHVRVHRHRYRGHVWYVVEDRATGRHHRFDPQAYRIVGALDGRRTMQELWDTLARDLREDSPSQDEIVQLLGRLSAADLVVTEASVDLAELFERHRKEERRRIVGRFSNPLALRFPLWDPDRALAAAARRLARVPAWLRLTVWLALVLPALWTLPAHWAELSGNFSDRLLAADNLWVMAVAFIVLKGLHELGHGLALRLRGAEVHEMGILLLLFYPVPYVDASGASAFGRKRDRIAVGAAGMWTEMALAAFALLAWQALEPGLLRSLAYNMVVVGSVTTVIFNANPLLRYDGYFILVDLIEIPNLGQRANAWWVWLIRRHALGIGSAKPPPATPAERRWFAAYAPAALVYRLSVTLGIAWFVGQQYFFIGVVLALWSLISGAAWPLLRGYLRLRADPAASARGLRVWLVAAGGPALAAVLLFTVPLPHHTRAEAVVSLPEHAILRAGTGGFVQRVALPAGAHVVQGDAIVYTEALELQAALRQQRAKIDEVQARLDAVWGQQPAAAARLQEELAREQAVQRRLQDEADRLVLLAPSDGELLLEQADDLPGRRLRKGEPVAYVVGQARPLLRVVVAQQQVDLVRRYTRSVSVRLPQAFDRPLAGRLVREVPMAARELPSASLGHAGGGSISVDPRDAQGKTALELMFEFEVELAAAPAPRYLGSRAYVAFEHPPEPIGGRLWRHVRRQLLSHFHV